MKTAEEILKKHISKMIGRSEDLFHSIDDMKKLPEWKSL